jgi:hypothetical protein
VVIPYYNLAIFNREKQKKEVDANLAQLREEQAKQRSLMEKQKEKK